MEKRYQAFISSTFRDLKVERQSVLLAIQKLNHIPAGMEMFTSANSAPWDVIKRIIEISDYYVLIVGGRYGSIDENGVSFTEREYDLAVETGVPVLAFLHAEPGEIPSKHTEQNPVLQTKLENFRAKVKQSHHCTFWKTPDDLAKEVVVALATSISMNPRPGWVRGDLAEESGRLLARLDDSRQENAMLREEIALLQEKLAIDATPQDFAQGSDKIELAFTDSPNSEPFRFMTTWHEVFMSIAWLAVTGADRYDLAGALAALSGTKISLSQPSWQIVITQLIALNLISVRNDMVAERQMRGKDPFGTITVPRRRWYLTEKGLRYFTRSKALTRNTALLDMTDDRQLAESTT